MWRVSNILSSRRARRDDAQQLPTTESSVHPPDVVRHTQQIRRGSLRGTEEPELVNTNDLKPNDIVIAIMGPTGSGKSTLVCAASGSDAQTIGHRLRSCTDRVSAVRFWDQECMRHIVLVDTPGFDDTFKSDLEILRLITEWLVSSYNKEKRLSGILYLHRITDNRVVGSSLKNLQVFRKLCGRDALVTVYLTTTMWDEVELSTGEKRLDVLKTEYWKTMISKGAQVACCRRDDNSPKQLVRQIIRDVSEYGTPPPQPELRQGPSSHLQEIYDVSRRGTQTHQQQGENRQAGSSYSQERSRRYEGEPPPVRQEPSTYRQEEPPKNDAVHGGKLAPQYPPEHVPSHSQGEHGGTLTPEEPLVEHNRGLSSHPQQRLQKYDAAHGGIPTSQPPVARQGPSPQSRNVGQATRIGREPTQTVLQGSVLTAQEPEIIDTRGQEVDNTSANAIGLKYSGMGLESHGKVLLIQEEIVELKKELKETAAGQQLYSQLDTLVEKQLELLRRIDKEKRAASDPEIMQDLRIEYNDLRAQIEDKLRQMQQLKLPWLKRFFVRRRD